MEAEVAVAADVLWAAEAEVEVVPFQEVEDQEVQAVVQEG